MEYFSTLRATRSRHRTIAKWILPEGQQALARKSVFYSQEYNRIISREVSHPDPGIGRGVHCSRSVVWNVLMVELTMLSIDPLGILEEGEVCYRFSQPRKDPTTEMLMYALEGEILVFISLFYLNRNFLTALFFLLSLGDTPSVFPVMFNG